MKVLLSIKPKYANQIFSGKKFFEYRKSIFKDKSVKTIVVYSSSPVKKVIGKFEIDKIIKDTPEIIWNTTNKYGGIEKKDYDMYFKDKSTAYAIKIKNAELFKSPISLKQYDSSIKQAPQSFIYLNKKLPITKRNIVFLSGIHGVGKTTLTKKILKSISIKSYTCSDLINKYIKSDNYKLVKDINSNQEVLIKAINNYLPSEGKILLDGHFSLLDSNKNIKKISIETFKRIAPNEIILVHENEKIIFDRLSKRENSIFTLELVRKMQNAEIEHAIFISKELNIPLTLINSKNQKKVLSIISAL